jgi:hypothetical protein
METAHESLSTTLRTLFHKSFHYFDLQRLKSVV